MRTGMELYDKNIRATMIYKEIALKLPPIDKKGPLLGHEGALFS
jgi:hypothetical protein